MWGRRILLSLLNGTRGSSEQFWRERMIVSGVSGWVTYSIGVMVLILMLQVTTTTSTYIIDTFRFTFRFLFPKFCFRSVAAHPTHPHVIPHSNNPAVCSSSLSQFRISEIICDSDLRSLIATLDGELHETEKWEDIIDRKNNLLSYNAKCCKPKGSPLKYLSVTVFEDCSAEMLRDFYMDSYYRKQWDKTMIEQEQLQVDESSGIEIGRSIKKFPLLTPREYVLAWRLWEGAEGTYYCFSKECDHPLAPRCKKYVRVGFLRSGWRIRKVPGRNACEIKMVHQEDAGLNAEMAKLAFAKGIWSYVCKMDNALRKYSAISHTLSNSVMSAITFIQKNLTRVLALWSSISSSAVTFF